MSVRPPGRARQSRPRAVTIAAAALWAASVVFIVASLMTARSGGPDDPGSAIVQGVAALMLVTVGAVLMTRLPGHLVGWLLAIGGTMIAIASSATGVADYGLNVHPGSVPAAIWVGWVAQSIWGPELACLFILLPLFYPTGRLPSPRWRAVVIIAIALAVSGGASSGLGPWTPDPYPVGNPLAVTGTAGDLMLLLSDVVGTGLLLVGGTFAVASLLVRYRRATTIERQQIKWFALVAMVAAVGGIVSIATNSSSGGAAPGDVMALVNTIAGFAIYGGLALLPVAIGIAVLRYRLYEIDRLISRTIAYGLLTLLLGTLFVAVILALQALVAPFTGSNELAVAGSTLLVAALFQPLRRRIQRLVDRRFNRSRYDAERTVAALAARLRDEVDLDAVRADLLATVDAALEPASASLWLRG